MIKKITFIIFLFTFAMLAPASAQTGISAEKQAAIKEFLTLINADNKTKDFVDIFSKQMDASRKTTVKAMLDERDDLTPAERKALEDALINDVQDKAKRFEERLFSKLNLDALMDEIMMSVYDKHYTLEEIKDLIVFYKTPTGQKSLKLVTTVLSESMQALQEKLLPKIPIVIKELQEEDRREIQQKIEAKKPRNNKRTS